MTHAEHMRDFLNWAFPGWEAKHTEYLYYHLGWNIGINDAKPELRGKL